MDPEEPREKTAKAKYGFLSRREYESMDPGSRARAVTLPYKEGPEVFFRGKPSTTTRLHEIFHATSTGEYKTPEGFAYEELQAHKYSKPGRDLLSGNFILDVAETMVRTGVKPARVVSSILSALKRMGYVLDRRQQSELLRLTKLCYSHYTGEGS